MLFTAFHQIGIVKAVNMLTDLTQLELFKKKCIDEFGYVPRYFEVLFEVTGFDRIGQRSEIKYIREITLNSTIWKP